VFLVHGWEGQWQQLGEFIAPLREKGFKVVAFDLLGHGESSGSSTDLFMMARSILKVREKLGEPHSLVCHSSGGLAALIAIDEGNLSPKQITCLGLPISYKSLTEGFCDHFLLSESIRTSIYKLMKKRYKRDIEEIDISLARKFRFPSLMIFDQLDPNISYKEALQYEGKLPLAEFFLIRGFGHVGMLKSRTLITRVLQSYDLEKQCS
jgi:pimeloyl-ACP methyl ester carboxylesterase